MKVLAIGSSGRVARLLQGAWHLSGDKRVRWTSRRADPSTNAVLCDPLTDDIAPHIPKGGIVFALGGPTPPATETLHQNVDIALSTLKAAQRAGAAHVFLVSSAAVYGDQAGELPETMPVRPVAPYGEAKAEMEVAVHAADPEIPYTILRIGNVAGADQLLGARGARTLDRFSDGSYPVRSYIGPITLARVLGGLFDHVERGIALPNVLNVASAPAVEMSSLLQAAGIGWRDKSAPRSAIREVRLDTTLLWSLLEGNGHATPQAIIRELGELRQM